MKVIKCLDYQEMSSNAAHSLLSDLQRVPDQWWVVATGNSPKGVYENLSMAHAKTPNDFKNLGIVKLDEWGGIPMNAPNSCETFIQQRILKPWGIPEKRYIAFDSDTVGPEVECAKIHRLISEKQPMGCCILGLGANGHIGFNEPVDALMPHCHVAPLSLESQQHQMVGDLKDKPTFGMTLGMADILGCRKIILLITGNGKQESVARLLSGLVSTHLPASFLWLHPDVECYLDTSSL